MLWDFFVALQKLEQEVRIVLIRSRLELSLYIRIKIFLGKGFTEFLFVNSQSTIV